MQEATVQNSEMDESTVRKLGVGSTGVMFGLISFFMAIVMILFLLFLSLIIPLVSTGGTSAVITYALIFSSLLSSWWQIVLFPFLYAIFGFLSGLVFALIYNLSAKIGKGIKLYTW